MLRYFLNIFYYLGKSIAVIWAKIYISDGTPIGAGLYISNKGGVIIGAHKIGNNCTVSKDVTVGMDKEGRKVTIENDVVILDNVVIYGDITVGKGAVVDANTVITKSLPGFSCFAGYPAKIISKNINSSDYLNKLP